MMLSTGSSGTFSLARSTYFLTTFKVSSGTGPSPFEAPRFEVVYQLVQPEPDCFCVNRGLLSRVNNRLVILPVHMVWRHWTGSGVAAGEYGHPLACLTGIPRRVWIVAGAPCRCRESRCSGRASRARRHPN